jgi:hypothetical protein
MARSGSFRASILEDWFGSPEFFFSIVLVGNNLANIACTAEATAVAVGLFGRSGPWASIPVFFALIFLAAWAGGVWIAPMGPVLFGVYWVPFVVFGLIFALLLAAAMVPARGAGAGERAGEGRVVKRRRFGTVPFNGFFFGLLGLLVLTVIVGYLV